MALMYKVDISASTSPWIVLFLQIDGGKDAYYRSDT